VRGDPAAARERLAGDTHETSVLGRPYDAQRLLFLEALGDAVDDIVHVLEQRSGLLSQHQQIAKR
jgi:hypothetical protein